MNALIPGTSIPVSVFRDEVSTQWGASPSNSACLVGVVWALSRAVSEYEVQKIGVSYNLFPSGESHRPEGMLVELGEAVLRLLALAGLSKRPVSLWDGLRRNHTDFYPDMFSIMARVLRLREDYPDDAIILIEKFAAQWVSRTEFWEIVMTKHLHNKGAA